MKKIYFFGAGRIGKYWLDFSRHWGFEPDGFIDNSDNLWGKLYYGLPVYSLDSMPKKEDADIVITCKNWKEVYLQLMEAGLSEKQLIYGHERLNQLLYKSIKKGDFMLSQLKDIETNVCGKILIDLQNGMVLGGVESWSYALAKQLKERGYRGDYILPANIESKVCDETYPACLLDYEDNMDEKQMIDLCVQKITENMPCTIICNFPQYTFWSACIAKQLYPELIKIIAVQHSDDQIYYQTYGLWSEYIDSCLVISSRMAQKILTYGMSKEKINKLEWKVPCKEVLERSWESGEMLQIGYAGRVTAAQKRADLFVPLVKELLKQGVRFKLNIAGIGDYFEIIQSQIQDENLGDYIRLLGYVERKQIPDFWEHQDIMICCSDLEGHSITQVEAMASGAVPVVMDVSGARDDVTDDLNGYVVPAGDIDMLAERIVYLSNHRNKLRQMGQKAYETIRERQMHMNQADLWEKLLRKE